MSKKRDLWNCLHRDDTDFPGYVLLALQLHEQPWTRHSKGHPVPKVQPGKRHQSISGPQLLLQKDLALLNPHVSKLTTDGTFGHPMDCGFWDFKICSPALSYCQTSFWDLGRLCRQLWLKRNCFSMRLKQQLAVKKGYCQVILRSFCKKLSMKGKYFFLEQGKAADRNAVLSWSKPTLMQSQVNTVLG